MKTLAEIKKDLNQIKAGGGLSQTDVRIVDSLLDLTEFIEVAFRTELRPPKEAAIGVAEDRELEKALGVEKRISEKTIEDNKLDYPGYLVKEIFVRFKTHKICLSTKEAVERTADDYKEYPSEYVKECIILAAFG